jgi:hypothetical protein
MRIVGHALGVLLLVVAPACSSGSDAGAGDVQDLGDAPSGSGGAGGSVGSGGSSKAGGAGAAGGTQGTGGAKGTGGSAGTGGAGVGGSAGHGDAGTGGTTGTGGATSLDGSASGITFMGRFDFTVPAEPAFEWSASAIEARFSGAQVSVTLDVTGTAFFEVLVDGQVQPVLTAQAGSHAAALATGLSNGTHDVLIVRRDEAYNGPAKFQGFDFGPGGQLLAAPAPPSRRIEVVGDSITAGYGNECPPWDQATGIRENAYLTWGAVAARSLNAEVHIQAKSGIALTAGNPTMPQIWPLTIPTDANSHWDFSRWIPDAVVINLGSNDWFFGGDPSAAFQTAYVSFLVQVRAAYPGAYIVCAMGPMLKDPGLSQQRTAVGKVIAARNAAGDANLGVLEFPVDTGALGYGCAGHPSVAEDAAMATLLEQHLRQKLGW